MSFYREVTRHCLGRTMPSGEGARAIDEAEAWMRQEAIANPQAMIRMAAPGFLD